MVKSKEWSWEISKDDIWEIPSEDIFYYVNRWKEKRYNTVLDLGCGLGRHTLLFAEKNFTASAMDLSEYAVKIVQEKAKKMKLSINVKIGDMNNLPFEDESFDCLIAYHVISHTDSKGIKTILNEINRVLKNDGEFYFTLCSKLSPSFTNGKFKKIDENTIMKLEGPEINIPHFYSSEEDIMELLKGIEIIKFRHTKDIFKESYGWHYYLLCKK